MVKKVCKNFVFVLVLFALGLALFLPGQNRLQASAEEKVVTQESLEDISTGDVSVIDERQLNSDGTINIQSVTSSDIEWIDASENMYGISMYVIRTVAGLASVAYHVNNGDVDSTTGQAYASATYALLSPMDLSGLIWTPIGTQDNPFTGVFLGGGIQSISNIQLDSNFSDRYQGFFGVVNGGSLSEIRISGNFSSYSTSSTRNTGTLVGQITNGEIINCVDVTSSSLNSVGSIDSNTIVFKSSYFNHSFAQLTDGSYGEVFASGDSANGTLRGVEYDGNVLYFANADHYIENEDEDTGISYYQIGARGGNGIALLRVLVNNNMQSYGGSVKNPIYATYIPTIRESLPLDSTGRTFVIRSGYRATFPTSYSEGACFIDPSEITWTETTTTVTFNEGYGTRTHTLEVPYDVPFNLFLNGDYSSLMLRQGYTLSSVRSGRGVNIFDGSDFVYTTPPLNNAYYYGFPYDGETVTFNWTAQGSRLFNFRFLIEEQDYQSGNVDYQEMSNNITSVSVQNATLNVNESLYEVSGFSSGTRVTLTFNMNAGYELALVEGSNNQVYVDSNNTENGYTGSNNVYTAGKQSGVYLNFSSLTGTDPHYTATNANNDNYNPVSVSAVVNNNGDVSVNRTYTVTIDNVVGTNGNIFFVVKRASRNITINTNIITLNSQPMENSFTWTYNGKSYNQSTFTVEARYGQELVLDFMVASTADYYVFSTNTQVLSSPTFTPQGDSYVVGSATYYKGFTLSAKIGNTQESAQVDINIGELRTYVQLVVRDSNGVLTENNDNKTKNISAIINETPGLGINAGAYVSLRNWAGGATDQVRFFANGYYVPTYLTITRVEDGQVVLTNGLFNQSVTDGAYVWNPTSATNNVFAIPYTGGESYNYIVTVYVEDAYYNLGWDNFTFNIDGTIIDGSQSDFLSNLFSINVLKDGQDVTASANFLPGEEITVRLSLTDTGRAILYGDTNGFITDNSNPSSIPEGFLRGNITSRDVTLVDSGVWVFDYLVGTYDFDFIYNFAYKDITLNVNGIVLSNNLTDIIDDTALINGYSGNYSYNFTTDGVSLSGQVFGGISIHTQYYLLGWYLSNGQVVADSRGNYGDITGASTMINGYMDITRASNSPAFTINVQGIVGQRTVTIDYNSGSAGHGEIITGDDGDDTLYYDSPITLKAPYINKGHTFNQWSYTVGTNNRTTGTGAFSITDGDWSLLFGNSSADDLQAWTSFAGEGSLTTATNVTLTLTATWDVIDYTLTVDGMSTSATLQIGDELRYVSNNTKNGGGSYYVFRNGVQVSSINGGVHNGYFSIGFTIRETNSISAIISGDYASFSFSGDNFDNLLGDVYNQLKALTVTTDREAATYKVYIENSDYYTYSVEGQSDVYGVDENGLYVVVTFDEIPTILSSTHPDFVFNSINTQGLPISLIRDGYVFAGTFYGIDVTSIYTTPSDITIRPYWTKVAEDVTVQSNIAFMNENMALSRNFYLLSSGEITFGNLTDLGDSSVIDIGSESIILSNGETVTGYGFNVTFNGDTTQQNTITRFNVNTLYRAGDYTITFYITVRDTLLNTASDTSYSVTSQTLTFTMNKNAFVFDSNITSVYNGTNEFVPATSAYSYDNLNDYGTVSLAYDFLGQDLTNGQSFIVDEIFKDFVLSGGDYTVGEGRDITFNINKTYFSSVTSVEGVVVSPSTDWSVLVEGVSQNGEEYSYTYQGGVDIVKARFTIYFGETSTYYFEGVELIVYTHTRGEVTFRIGSVDFTYNLTRIVYNGEAVSRDTVFTGAENRDVFTVIGLTVDGYNYSDVDASFEYLLDGNFNLLNSDNALKLNYAPRYLMAENGQLLSELSVDYKNIADSLYIANVLANGESVNITTSQYTHQINSQVLFSVVNNNSPQLAIYINRDLIATYSLSFDIVIDITTDRLSLLTPLAWNSSTDISTYEPMLDNPFSDPTGQPRNSFNVSSALSNGTTYAVLTDVRKVTVDYNGGHNAEGDISEIIYVSAGSRPYFLVDPTFDYAGLQFDGYSYIGNDPTLSQTTGGYNITAHDGGPSLALTALWKLVGVAGNQIEEDFNYYASLTGLTLNIEDVLTLDTLEGGRFTYTLANEDFSFTANNGVFTIRDAQGRAPVTMSGSYTLTVTLFYQNMTQGIQMITREFTVSINISRNEIGIESAMQANLVFNNSDRKENLLVNVRQNGQSVENITLANLLSQGEAKYGVTLTIDRGNDVINAGDYLVTIAISQAYQDFFTLESGYDRVTFTIEQFELILTNYQNQISISKDFGLADPALEDTIIIAVNNNDEVLLRFTRQPGEAVGNYLLSNPQIVNQEDQNNYFINAEGFEAYFEIVVPNTNLQIALDGNLSFVYNGYALGNLTVSYDSDLGKFVLTGTAGEEEVSQTFSMYYLSGANIVQIPESERNTFAGYIEFVPEENNNKNVGRYSFSVAMTDTGLEAGWSNQPQITNDTISNANITITKRTITLSNVVKVFDQTATFTWTNNGQNMGISLTADNIVAIDTVTISGVMMGVTAGEQRVTMTLDSISDVNYTLVYPDTMIVSPSQITITPTTSTTSIVYGAIASKGEDLDAYLQTILDNITIIYNGGSVANTFISLSDCDVTNGSYSTGGYLEVGQRTFRFTLTSTNYTFGGAVGELGDSYQMSVEFTIEITQRTLTVTNSSRVITKNYDGNTNLLSTYLNQNVNIANGYYISNQLLAGDVITVVGGSYSDKEIGNLKNITLVFDGDSANYNITTQVVGNITSVDLTFVKNPEPEGYSFADDGEDFENTQNLVLSYGGNIDNDIITPLLNEANFVVRRGYTQIGWMFNWSDESGKQSEEISLDMTNKDLLLQSAVDSGSTGLTIDAIWQIDSYQIEIILNNSSITPQLSLTLTREYYSSLNDTDIAVLANTGYTFEGISLSPENGEISQSVDHTNAGSFNVHKIVGDMTVEIITEEITVRVIIDYNSPEGLEVYTNSEGWSGVTTRDLSYSQLMSVDLPELYMVLSPTFNFDYWSTSEAGCEASVGDSIWDRLPSIPTEDNLTGITFVANWTEADVTLSLQGITNGNATVYLGEQLPENILTPNDGVYNLKYNDDIIVVIESDDWYKWSGLTINGRYDQLSNSQTNTTDGQFSLQIKDNLTIVITISEISVGIITSYETPFGSSVTTANLSRTYTLSAGRSSWLSYIGLYQATKGTYSQVAWETQIGEQSSRIELDEIVQDTIVSLFGGIPTADQQIWVNAVWEGEEYTLTFYKNDADAVFDGYDSTFDGLQKTYRYGDVLSGLPTLTLAGEHYIWTNTLDDSETITNGQRFTTAHPDSQTPYELSYSAFWSLNEYNVSFVFDGISNADKIVGNVMHEGWPYSSGSNIISLYMESEEFVINLATGYEIDLANVNISPNGNAVVALDGNTFIIRNISGDVTVTLAIKAKDYHFTIEDSIYETISQTSFDVQYDQNISALFDNVTFERGGYQVYALYAGSSMFATKSGSTWTFNSMYVQNGLYKYDGDLTLKAIWQATGDYLTINSMLSYSNIPVYNGSEQLLASSTITSLTTGEDIYVGRTLGNGDVISAIYYLLGGVQVESDDSFRLLYKDAFDPTNVQFIIEVQDSLALNETTITYRGNILSASIARSNIVTQNSNLQSYYSGSENFYETAENDYGTLTYTDGTTLTELSVQTILLVAESGEYNVGTHDVIYYLSTGDDFNANNFNGLTFENGRYILANPGVTAEVVKTPITITFNEKGYFNGQRQQVGSPVATKPDFASEFIVEIHSITTNDSIVGVYGSTQFDYDVQVTRGGQDETDNFEIIIDGSYEIISSAQGYQVDIEGRYFDSSEALALSTNYNLAVTGFSYGGENLSISGSAYNYMVGDQLIFSVTGNGSQNPQIIIAEGESVEFTIAFTGNISLLSWTNSLDETELLATLNTLESEASVTTTVTFSQAGTYYAVATDYKAVFLDGGDGEDGGYVYVQLGSQETLPTLSWTGFNFVMWETTGSGVNVRDNMVYVGADAGINATTITAIWEISTPQAVVVNPNITQNAKIAKNANSDEITLAQLLGENGITNYNDEDITYTFSWQRSGREIYSGQTGFTVPANTSSNGAYSLVVMASRTGYVTKTATFNFNVTINKLEIGDISINSNEFDYAHRDLSGEILFNFTRSDIGEVSLSELLDPSTSTFYFVISGESVVKNAGTYILTLALDQTVFNDKEYSETIVVNRYQLSIAQSDIPSSISTKMFGTADPEFVFTKEVFAEPYTEEVTITLTRTRGEEIGSYAFTSASTTSSNFQVSLEESFFEITKSTYTLNIEIDNTLTFTYSKYAPVFSLSYNAQAGRWMVSAGDSSSSITLYMTDGENRYTLSQELYRVALNGVTLTYPSAITANSYNLSNLTITTDDNANFDRFSASGSLVIERLGLVISSVTKVFDRNSAIVSSGVTFENLINGDDVTLTGLYASPLAGEDIELNSLALSGDDANNYYIANEDITGKITPLEIGEEQTSFSLTDTSFVYGELAENVNIEMLIANGVVIDIDGITTDLANGYIEISGASALEQYISGAGYLRATTLPLTVTITSTNFTFGGNSSIEFTVEITVSPLELDLSGLSSSIAKDYDGNTTLPSDLNTNINNFGVLAGDSVSIDLTNSRYQDENIGQKRVILVLTGDDSSNYSVRDNVTGAIYDFTVTFNVNAETEDPALVTDGAFVSDGQHPVVRNTAFRLGYPSLLTGEEIIALLTLPTRAGYTATGWAYLEDGQYVTITAENILALIAELASTRTPSITIYTIWQIDSYDVIVSGDLEDYQITGDGYSEGKARYYSDITITLNTNKGLKISSYNFGSSIYGNVNSTGVGYSSGRVEITHVGSNLTLQVNTSAIKVTFVIDPSLPAYTDRVDSVRSLEISYDYTTLAGLTGEDLPQLAVTGGTYYLLGYSYQGQLIGERTLQEIVDEIYPTLDQDVTINIVASWQGEEYHIYFNAAGGELQGLEGEYLTVNYGDQLENLPVAYIAGRDYVWEDSQGITYVNGDIFHSIGSQSGDFYTLTLTARYSNATYQLTVEFDSRLIVTVDGEPITTGVVFDLVYNEDSITLTVTPNAGYGFNFNVEGLSEGQYSINQNQITIQNLTDDYTLNIETTILNNTLTLVNNNIESFEVSIDGQPQVAGQSEFDVPTESEVVIIYHAREGYFFDNTSVVYGATSSSVEVEISLDRKTLTLTWTDMTAGLTITTTANPVLNTITIADASDIFLSLQINGVGISVNGTTYEVLTGQDLTLTATLRYGYELGQVNSSVASFISSQNCTYSSTDGYYHLTASLTGINSDFSLDFEAELREYIFNLVVADGQESWGQITAGYENQTVTFGSELFLRAEVASDNYIFAGWEANGTIITSDAIADLTLDASLRSVLESVAPGQTIQVIATFRENLARISMTAGGNGQFNYSQGQTSGVVLGGRTEVASLRYFEEVTITIIPDEGYELGQVLINNLAIDLSEYNYNEQEGTFTFAITLDNLISSINISFVASEAYVHVQAALQVNFEITYGTDAGGLVYISDQNGSQITDESYYLNADGTLYYDFGIATYTNERIYLIAQPKSGFNVVFNTTTQGVIQSQFETNGITVYVFSGIKDGTEIQAIFTAIENTVNVVFTQENSTTSLDAGRINVDTSSLLVRVSANNSSSVQVHAVTGSTISMDINTHFAYDLLADGNGNLSYRIVYADGRTDISNIFIGRVTEEDPTINGFTYSSTLLIEGIDGDATIYIHVVPKVYNITFDTGIGRTVTLENVVSYGQIFSLGGITEEQRAIILSTREGFTLDGYYTKQVGQGKKYLDNGGNVLEAWTETGYTWNGRGYTLDSNYDPETQTFTLYAAWIYDKSTITITFRPEGFDDNLEDVLIEDVIVNISDNTYWTSQDNKWYAQVSAGLTLRLQAYEYPGYEFRHWLVSVNGGEPVERTSDFEMVFELGNYEIRAVYYPTFTLTVDGEGGTTNLLQNGIAQQGSFSPEELVTLEAIPNPGYNFLYWINTDTDQRIYGTLDETTGRYTYTFDQIITTPLNLVAYFEGKPVTININTTNFSNRHQIIGVYVNNVSLDYTNSINAQIGDEVRIVINKDFGYNILISGGNFEQSENSSTGYYEYSYRLDAEHLVENGEGYLLNVLLDSDREEINLIFNISVEAAVDNNEWARAGSLTFTDAQGLQHDAEQNQAFTVVYGDSVSLTAYANTNYLISDILLSDGTNTYTIYDLFVNNKVVIDSSLLEKYEVYNIEITVLMTRMVWIQEEYRASGLVGLGTEDSPYFIRNAAEMAFVAYAVNNGLVNNSGLSYGEAYYRVVADIDFHGKFWEPIGTPAYNFNGVMDIGEYNLTNITLYRIYTNPDTSYGGLFWCLGENAQIIRDSNTLKTALIIIAIIILLILLIILIILYMRHRRKKKMEEIANV